MGDTQESVLSRLKKFIDHKGLSVRQFEQSVGMSNGSFASQLKRQGTIGVDRLENILHVYTEINPLWLLTGSGSMLVSTVSGSFSEAEPAYTATGASSHLQERITRLEDEIKYLKNENELLREMVDVLKSVRK